ncbi:phosphate ABC transporter permease [Hydrococcus rivularis NIES-593]|uniref:Phosphate ABC transporter permease n=1 Tax=Hydrococcus rivularis NIES-593 TaxID=1921803 RepID=A0A1U7H8N8_9CYAN|nr:phosphate ABC transporter permease [Hydrococcus rivularis]OKH19672.1 phosphate ABC transporter permease [Hydrococcus rivularis NIES-593]
MLVPLTRQTFEEIIPLIATGPQYAYYWGKPSDFIRRLLISMVALTTFWLLGKLFGEGWLAIKLILDIIAGLYWLWSPVYWASVRNNSYRRFPYSGFWRGQVLDVYITEELIGEEETVNKRGELVIIENKEKRINLEVGDKEGFRATVQAPLRRIHKGIIPGQIAEMLVLSKQPDLYRIDKITDVYLPRNDLWIGEYPYLRRDVFLQVSRELGGSSEDAPPSRRRASSVKRRRR